MVNSMRSRAGFRFVSKITTLAILAIVITGSTQVLAAYLPASGVAIDQLIAPSTGISSPITLTNGAETFRFPGIVPGPTGESLPGAGFVIDAVNDAPVAGDDAYSVNEGHSISTNAPGVLGNDTDTENLPLTAVLVTDVSSGILNLTGTGAFDYTPNAGFTGIDSFSYTAWDGTSTSSPANVLITVTTNTKPVAANDSYSTNESTVLTIDLPGVLANDSDPQGDSLTALLVSDPTNGALTWNENGAFVYSPVTNFYGSDTFTYRAFDGQQQSSPASVELTINLVNTAPTAVPDAYSTNKNQSLSVTAANGVLSNDTDPDGDTLTVGSNSSPAHGSLTLNQSDGSFTYTPNTGFSGIDSFDYRAWDGFELSNANTVSITVNNLQPSAINDGPYQGSKNLVLTINSSGVLSNDSDPDGDSLTAILDQNPTHGSVNLNPSGSFTYTPNSGYVGSDSFTYFANDGTVNSVAAAVNISVINTVPVAANDAYSTDRNLPLTVNAAGVLQNDQDANSDPLTASMVDPASHGTAALSPDGSFTYTPNLDYAGADSFTYRANDGTANSNLAVVNITVVATNRPPAAADNAYTMDQRGTLPIAAPGVLGNDTDLDGDPLTAILVSDVAHGGLVLNANGSFTYTPETTFFGLDTFTYQASDGTATSGVATVTITVNAVNLAPVAVNDNYQMDPNTTLTIPMPGVLANDTDPDNNAMTAVLGTGPLHGSVGLKADGSFSYTPTPKYTGQDSFTYRASDGSLTSPLATVTIKIINHPPTAASDSYTAYSGRTTSYAIPGVLSNDSDPDGNALTASLKTGLPGLTFRTNGSFSYTAAPNFTGVVTFTYAASDGQSESNVVSVTLTVVKPNTAPVANDDQYLTNITAGKSFIIAAPGVLGNDIDAENTTTLTANLVTTTTNGELTLSLDGSFVYTPNPGYNGTDTFTYSVSDGDLISSPATATIVVDIIPPPPPVWIQPVTNGGIYISEGETVSIETIPDSSEPITRMYFLRWDSAKNKYETLTNLTAAPYQYDLNTSQLNPGWNQIFVMCYDQAGNSSGTQFIWVVLQNREVVYLPLVKR